MNNYLVTYDLKKPGQNYQRLYDAIWKYRNIHPLESVWFIKSNDPATAISMNLQGFIDKDGSDLLFVCQIPTNFGWWLHQPAWDFLNWA